MSGKALDPDRNEDLRRAVASMLAEEFDGNKTALAKALKLSPSAINEFLGGTRGAGAKMLNALADYTGRSVSSWYSVEFMRADAPWAKRCTSAGS